MAKNRITQTQFWDWDGNPLVETIADFDGSPDVYNHDLDHKRLAGQLLAVFELMKDGKWRSVPEIHESVKGSQTGISARLRDLRKAKFGGYCVETRRVPGLEDKGHFEYRLVLGVDTAAPSE